MNSNVCRGAPENLKLFLDSSIGPKEICSLFRDIYVFARRFLLRLLPPSGILVSPVHHLGFFRVLQRCGGLPIQQVYLG